MGKKKFVPLEVAAKLCKRLSELGCVYEWEGVNSRYVYVRHPRPAKFRVSDHPPNLERFLRDGGRARGLFFDIGPHAMTVEAAIVAYRAHLPASTPAQGSTD